MEEEEMEKRGWEEVVGEKNGNEKVEIKRIWELMENKDMEKVDREEKKEETEGMTLLGWLGVQGEADGGAKVNDIYIDCCMIIF